MSTQVFTGDTTFFPGIERIAFEGPDSDNPLAFKVYDANRQIGDRTMAEHLRFAACYWHSFCGNGADPFGPGSRAYPWDAGTGTALHKAEARLDAAFEFFTKLGVPYWCFHDVDLSPDADDIGEYEQNLQHMVALAQQRQQATGMQLLWGTANLFSHPRYMNGASTNPDFAVVARAAVQVKAALDATVALGGANYVFWGGREGYASLHNTQMKREQEHMARFLTAARDYGRSIGFTGNFLIEPKPMEPMKHQYDFDSATCVGFLRAHGLDQDFKLNIEANHATLSGHSFEHDLQVASDAGMLGMHRRQPRQSAERLGYRPVPERSLRHRRRDAGRAAPGRPRTGRPELRRQGAPRIHRRRRPVRRAHWRHGRIRPRSRGRARAARSLPAGNLAPRTLRQFRRGRRPGVRERRTRAAGPACDCATLRRAAPAQWAPGTLREPGQPVPASLSARRHTLGRGCI